MNVYELRFCNGEVGELRQLDDGALACPICGTPWARFPPYMPNDGVLGPKHVVSTPAVGEVCPGCEVEFGVDEGCSAYSPGDWMRWQWARHRTAWLKRERWSPEVLRQLHENLGITEDQARRDAMELG